MLGQDARNVGGGLGVPGDVAAQGGLDAEIQAADAGEHAADEAVSGPHGRPFVCSHGRGTRPRPCRRSALRLHVAPTAFRLGEDQHVFVLG